MALTSPGLRQGCSGESHPFLPNTLICFAGLIVVGRLVCFTLPSDRSDPTRPDKIFGSFRLLISRDPHVSPSRAATEKKRFQKEENVQRAAALWGESGHFDSGFTALKWPPQWPDGAERSLHPHPPTHTPRDVVDRGRPASRTNAADKKNLQQLCDAFVSTWSQISEGFSSFRHPVEFIPPGINASPGGNWVQPIQCCQDVPVKVI